MLCVGCVCVCVLYVCVGCVVCMGVYCMCVLGVLYVWVCFVCMLKPYIFPEMRVQLDA